MKCMNEHSKCRPVVAQSAKVTLVYGEEMLGSGAALRVAGSEVVIGPTL